MSTATIPLTNDSLSRTGASRWLRIFLTETRYEFLRLLRTRAFSLSVIGFPVVFYACFALMMNRNATISGMSVAKYLLGGYAVFGAVGAALFGIGVSMANELEAGWLELKRASPMPPAAYLLAKCVTAIAFGIIIVSLLTVLGILWGHVTLTAAQFAHMLGLTIAGAVPFACMGLVLALLAPANSAPGIANMIYLPMSFCSGLWIPISQLPHFVQKIAPALPTYHLSELMLAALGFGASGSALAHWSNLLGCTLLMLGVAWILWNRREATA